MFHVFMQAALWKSLENQKDIPWLEIIGDSITSASWISPNVLLHITQLNSFSCLHASSLWKSLENQKDFPWLGIIGNSVTFASWISPNILLHIPQLNSFSCLHASSFVKVFRKSKGYSLTWDHRRFNNVCFLNKSKCLVAHTTAKQFFMSSCRQLCKSF